VTSSVAVSEAAIRGKLM